MNRHFTRSVLTSAIFLATILLLGGSLVPGTALASNSLNGIEKIAYASHGTDYSLYIMDADGNNEHHLVDQAAPVGIKPDFSPDGKQIAFASFRDGNAEIYVIDVSGQNLRRLTSNPASDTSPAWSPDGSQITFYSDRNGAPGIYIMNANGTDQRPLSRQLQATSAVWSPVGKMLVCAAFIKGTSNRGIFLMKADGTGVQRLTNNPGDDSDPAWSPDGKQIAFTSKRNNKEDIYIMDAGGQNQQRLTTAPGDDSSPSWSPDGKSILFTSARGGERTLYIMNADGSNQRQATSRQSQDIEAAWSPDGLRIAFVSGFRTTRLYTIDMLGSNRASLSGGDPAAQVTDDLPSWSPDGKRIAFVSERDGNREIYVMDANGQNQSRLTHNSVPDDSPTWSPDGKHIAFRSEQNGSEGIFVMDADGQHPRRLTKDPITLTQLTWSPDGNQIAFGNAEDGGIYIVRIDGTDLNELVSGTYSNSTFSWSPDGTRIVFTGYGLRKSSKQLIAIDLASRHQTFLPIEGKNPDDFDPAWSPDGRFIAFVSGRWGNTEIYIMSANGTYQSRLTHNSADDGHPVWSPSGRYIAFVSRRDGNSEIYVMTDDGGNQRNLTRSSLSDEVNFSWAPQ